MIRTKQQQQAAEKVTLVGAVIDGVLGLLKILFGISAHSAALIADGIHSLSDLLTDTLVVFVLRLSGRGADASHPWGHGRFETVGTVVLGCLLIAVAGAMAYESVDRLFTTAIPQRPEWPALTIAALSIGAKEWIFRYTRAIGEKLRSDLIIANAWHSRSDALSSIVVLIGIAGAMAGIWWLDLVAALAVAALVGKIGWSLTWDSIKELVDTALPQERVAALKQEVMTVEGIINVHSFKSRHAAGHSLLEMHIQVGPLLSASEAHYIGDTAACRLRRKFNDISHIIYHVDTYNDEDESYCKSLPLRSEVQATLRHHLQEIAPQWSQWQRLTLHYTDKINIELFYAAPQQPLSPQELQQKLNARLRDSSWFGAVHIWTGSPR